MLKIPYGKTFIEFDETGANVLTSRIDELKAEGDGLSIVKAAMENPIESPRLCELAKGKKTRHPKKTSSRFIVERRKK